MNAEQFDRLLDQAWAGARSKGFISEPVTEIRRHAAGFVPAAWRVQPPTQLIDLGSGPGIPGLHLADMLENAQVRLVDASERRCTAARAGVAAVGLAGRVTVVHARADDLARAEQWRAQADAVVARLFGPAAELAECGLPLLAVGGRMVVSVNQSTGEWWRSAPLTELGAAFEAGWETDAGFYVSVVCESPAPERYPRRSPARRRAPWPDR